MTGGSEGTPSYEQLTAQLAEVNATLDAVRTAQLAEVNAALDAVRAGAVDAVLSAPGPGGRMIPLDGADGFFRTLVTEMQEGAASIDAAGTVLYANPRFAELVGLPLSKLIGCTLGELTTSGGRPAAQRLLAQAASGPARCVLELLRDDGRPVPAALSAAPIGGERPEICLVAMDLTEQKATETKLRMAEEQYRGLLESAPEAMVVVDGEGITQLANAECERMFGYSREVLVGSSVEMLMPERFQDPHREHRAGLFPVPGSRPMGTGLDLWGRRQDGSEFPVDISLSSLETDQGVLVTAVIRDVEVERRAAESLTLLETLQSSAPVGLVFVDRDFRVQRINETLAAFSDVPMKDQMGRLVVDVAPGIWPQLEPAFTQVLDTGEALVNQEVHLVRAQAPGQVVTLLSSFYPVRVRGEIVGVGTVAVDITDRRDAEEFRKVVMESMAEGLYVLDSGRRLMYMNASASRILGFTEAELSGKLVHEAIHYQHGDGSAFPAVECEICQMPAGGRPFRNAEDAFTRKDGTIFPVAYSAAPLGVGAGARGAVVAFHDTTEERTEEARVQRELNMMAWVGRIRDALDDDRLVLYAQPIMPLGDGEPSEELLVRMLGLDGEVIAPGSFLPAAEKYGLIGEIDRWVVTQAVRLAADGRHVHVHANLSADSITNLDLLAFIERAIRDIKADPSKLGFEITETALMGDIDAGETFTRGLADIGCSLSLDDFGTGFGSFIYLQRLPFSYLKIDIEFVRDLPTNEANQHLVRGIVNLAKGFGLRTIAEGVGSAETLELLRDYGVDFVQGFHIGRPAPITQA